MPARGGETLRSGSIVPGHGAAELIDRASCFPPARWAKRIGVYSMDARSRSILDGSARPAVIRLIITLANKYCYFRPLLIRRWSRAYVLLPTPTRQLHVRDANTSGVTFISYKKNTNPFVGTRFLSSKKQRKEKKNPNLIGLSRTIP
jgi:hypothetical protein